MSLSERKGPCLEKRINASKRIDDYILKKRRSKVYKIWNVQLKARWLESVLLTRQENSTMRRERHDMTGNPRRRKTGVSSSNNRSLNYRTIRLSHWSRRNRMTHSHHWKIRIQWRQQRPRYTTKTHRYSSCPCCPLSTSIEICTAKFCQRKIIFLWNKWG